MVNLSPLGNAHHYGDDLNKRQGGYPLFGRNEIPTSFAALSMSIEMSAF
jgi:hypothetical protein